MSLSPPFPAAAPNAPDVAQGPGSERAGTTRATTVEAGPQSPSFPLPASRERLPHGGLGVLLRFWAALLLCLGSGALVLELLGSPEKPHGHAVSPPSRLPPPRIAEDFGSAVIGAIGDAGGRTVASVAASVLWPQAAGWSTARWSSEGLAHAVAGSSESMGRRLLPAFAPSLATAAAVASAAAGRHAALALSAAGEFDPNAAQGWVEPVVAAATRGASAALRAEPALIVRPAQAATAGPHRAPRSYDPRAGAGSAILGQAQFSTSVPPVSPNEQKCRTIVARAQLGEELSNADRGFLRAGCR